MERISHCDVLFFVPFVQKFSAPRLEKNVDNYEIEYDATSGSIEYAINHPVTGGVLTASTTADWLTIEGTELA